MQEATRILVVDDEPRGVELARRVLRLFGQVDGALSGEEAWAMIEAQDYQLVVSDQRMPGMDGVELLTRVSRRHPHTARILLTGYADVDATIDAINRGRVHAYVSKPCDPDRLRSTVRGVLSQVQLERQNSALLDSLARKNRELVSALESLREMQQRVVDSEKLAAIGRVSAMIVHDLRGPLSVLRSAAGALIRDGESMGPHESREIAREIQEETDRIERMCAELQTTNQVGQSEPHLSSASLDDLVSAAVATVIDDASSQGVRVDQLLACPLELPLDPLRIRRAVLNLAYNALEAMPHGGILRIETASEGDRVRLSVLDTGCGVPESVRDRIFEPLVTAGKPGGSGLGLAVVSKVARDHGGGVELGKAEGFKTAFHMRLPRSGPTP